MPGAEMGQHRTAIYATQKSPSHQEIFGDPVKQVFWLLCGSEQPEQTLKISPDIFKARYGVSARYSAFLVCFLCFCTGLKIRGLIPQSLTHTILT